MNTRAFFCYRRMLAPIAVFVLRRIVPFLPSKVQQFVYLKEETFVLPFTDRPIWFHCASGEFEYARPVIREIKAQKPHVKILVTYSSPSFRRNIERDPFVDYCLPAPWDLKKHVSRFLDNANPLIGLFARTDTWPELLFQSRQRGIPLCLFSAVLSTKSSRLHWIHRRLFCFALSQFNEIFCVSKKDVDAFETLALKGPSITPVGDTRFDQVIYRLENPKPLPFSRSACAGIVGILGSSWPEDENAVLPAFRELSQKNPTFKLIIVPHEPSEPHILQLTNELKRLHLTHTTMSDSLLWGTEAVFIVNRVGVLAECYTLADFAIIGGSFGPRQVHSVLEALAANLPVIVGPNHHQNREVEQGKRWEVYDHGCRLAAEKNGRPHRALAAVTSVSNHLEIHQVIEQLTQKNSNFVNQTRHIDRKVKAECGASKKIIWWIEKIAMHNEAISAAWKTNPR